MIKPAPDAPLCCCSRVTCEWGWKGPVGGKDLEATVSCAYNGFVYHAQARWVGFKFDQGGPPASIENETLPPTSMVSEPSEEVEAGLGEETKNVAPGPSSARFSRR